MKQLSVVIPSFNAVKLLQQNLPVVMTALRTGDELLVVDDAGTDATTKWLCEEFKLESVVPTLGTVPPHFFPNPDKVAYTVFQNTVSFKKKSITVTAVRLHHNLRFAGAANLGVLVARHELVFLCNNDVLPEDDCFAALIPHFDSEAVFAVGCLEYEDSKQGQQSGKNILFFKRGLFQHNRASEFSAGETAWASGGSALYDRLKYLTLGGFDQAFYPAYWEDIDLSFQARQRGWHILFEPDAVVYHKHESTNSDVFGHKRIAEMSWKNAFVFTWKNANWWQRLQYLWWLPYWSYKRAQIKN